jgi:hypothetical protein
MAKEELKKMAMIRELDAVMASSSYDFSSERLNG